MRAWREMAHGAALSRVLLGGDYQCYFSFFNLIEVLLT